MALAAAQCVDRVAAILASGSTAAGPRVYTSRVWPLAEAELPALLVFAEGETVTAASIDYPWLQRHDLAVRVQGYCRNTESLDDEMNGLAESVLQALFATQANAELQPLTSVTMTCTEIDRFMSKLGPADVGQVTVSLDVQFHTASNNPASLI